MAGWKKGSRVALYRCLPDGHTSSAGVETGASAARNAPDADADGLAASLVVGAAVGAREGAVVWRDLGVGRTGKARKSARKELIWMQRSDYYI